MRVELEVPQTHLGTRLQVEEAVEGDVGAQVAQEEIVPVLVNGPFQRLQVPGLEKVFGKDVPGQEWREGTGRFCHPLPVPGWHRRFFSGFFRG